MPSENLVSRLLDHDQKLRAAEASNPVLALTRIERENARLQAENKARSEALGIGKSRDTRRTEKSQAAAYQRQKKIQALYAEAFAAQDDPDAFKDVEVTDEEGFTYTDTANPRFEDAIAGLMAFGSEAEPFLDTLDEHFGIDAERELVAERNAVARYVQNQKAQQEALVRRRKDAEKLEKRIEELIDLNPQFNPYDPGLVNDIEHYREQAKAAELPEDKRAFIAQIRALEVEQGRRALAQDSAARLYVNYLANAPADTPLAEAESAFISSLQVADAEYEGAKMADRVTRKFQADADAANVGADSRDADGKLVLVSPDGKNILSVTDDGAGPLLVNDYVPIRQFEAQGDPDYLAALNPQPDEMAQAMAFADKWNARDHEAEAEAALIEYGKEMKASTEAAAAAEAEREARNSTGQLIEEMEARLGREPGS